MPIEPAGERAKPGAIPLDTGLSPRPKKKRGAPQRPPKKKPAKRRK